VHHRVKNNLHVVASLLSIHGRSATKPEAKAAYSAIGRRVDALSVVHRHHYAELEENRGIALRPLLTELAADLRSSAPVEARGMRIELDLDAPSTTQDVAVAAAFLITEIVEFAMLRHPEDTVEISLRREGELIGTLAMPRRAGSGWRPGGYCENQFERIVEGLARQLRSLLDRSRRYTVTLPVFPTTDRQRIAKCDEFEKFHRWEPAERGRCFRMTFAPARYPTKWGPICQPSPVAHSGPHFALNIQRPPAPLRAARQCVRRIARMANS
jgi:two-component sensor histidine kinase